MPILVKSDDVRSGRKAKAGGYGWHRHQCRVVSRFLSRRFHPKSRWLFPFYSFNITLRTDLLTFRVTGAVFKIAGEMRQLPASFGNPAMDM